MKLAKTDFQVLLVPVAGALVTFALARWLFLPIIPPARVLELADRQRDLAHRMTASASRARTGGGAAALAVLIHGLDEDLSSLASLGRSGKGWLPSPLTGVEDEIQEFTDAWGNVRPAVLALTRGPVTSDPSSRSSAPLELARLQQASDNLLREVRERIAFRRRLLLRIAGAAAITNGILLFLSLWFLGRKMREWRRAGELLRESRVRHEAMVEITSDAIVVTDHTGRIVDWNRGAAALYGYTAEEIIGQSATLLMTSGQAEVYRAHQAQIASEGRSSFVGKPFEGEGVKKDGTVFTMELSVTVWEGTVGRTLTGVIVRDITERKRGEVELRRLAQAVEQAAEAIVMTERDGTIVYVNPAFERVSGYGRGEILGQNPRLLKSGKQGPEFYRHLWDTLLRGEVWSGRMINRRRDGTLYQEDAIISPVRDPRGVVINYVAVKRDITQEVSLESRLRQSQKMEAIGRLAGGVAHDFNNLLTAIMGYGQLIRPRLAPDDSAVRDLDEVLKAAGRAAALTRQLLAFSRQQVLEPKVVNVNAIVTDVHKMLRRLIGEEIDLVSHAAPDLGNTRVDPGQVEQVLMNLAVNARDAMPNGGRLTIETANVELGGALTHLDVTPGRYIMIAVSDNGTGMSPEVKAHLFEPFFTTKEGGKGTGLGLSTVHGIVKQSGGDIEVYTELGQGTTFKIYLPRVEQAAGAPDTARATGASGGSETILLVEDEKGIRTVLRRSLESAGYTVIEALDGSGAIAQCESRLRPIDLLVTDVVMPLMSGPELVERISRSRPELRVLYISGYADRALVHQGMRAHGTAFLQKPFTPDTLLRKVRELLDPPLERAA